MTKRELLAHIRCTPSSVESKHGTTMYRIALADDGDPSSGVWISLSSDGSYAVDDYGKACVRITGQKIPLTRKEADSVAVFIAKTMKMRQGPWLS